MTTDHRTLKVGDEVLAVSNGSFYELALSDGMETVTQNRQVQFTLKVIAIKRAKITYE